MRPQPIGIVGGAGPLAGAYLLERILSLASSDYGCYKDGDFPQVFLISFPFSEMLSAELDAGQLQNELSRCLNLLRQNGATVLAIACNTLHAFLDEDPPDLVHLPRSLARAIPLGEKPLVLCTSTSARFALHQRFFPCVYPSIALQEQIDTLIDQILKGAEPLAIISDLLRLLEAERGNTVVLGCTELSLFARRLPTCAPYFIDPLEIMARRVLEKSFSNIRGLS